jgi:AraC family transcriptional regulator
MQAPSQEGGTADVPAGRDMTDPVQGRSSLTPGGPDIASVDEHNPVWSLPGYHADNARSWGPISASVVTRPAGEGVWRSDYHRILYDPVGYTSTGTGTLQFENGPVRKYQYLPNQVSFVPRGVIARSNRPITVQFIQIRQTPETYDALISDMVRGGAVDLEPTTPFDDPLVSQIASTIANEMVEGFHDRILADAPNTALAVQITRRFVDRSAIALTPSNGLSRERLKRVQDYIEAHLDNNRLTLTELAGVACLSPYHFSRSFKQATGVGPQRYVIQRRLERAKTLIRRTNQSLALIAQEAGFADQSHLTSIFRRELGVTPGHFRAALA